MSAEFELLASLGLSVFPLAPTKKTPPYGFKWGKYHTERATPADLSAWQTAGYNVAIATGALSGVVVLDCDSTAALADARARGLPETLHFTTPRGDHFAFAHPGGHVANRAAFLPGMDIRGDRGFIVGPGSTFVPTPDEVAKGKVAGTYEIVSLAPPAPLPAWLVPLLVRDVSRDTPPVESRIADMTSAYGLRAMTAELSILAAAGAGNLNSQINASAFALGQLVGGGEIVASEAYEALLECLAGHGVGDEEKALGTLERGWNAGITQPRCEARTLTALEAFGVRDAPPPPAGERPIEVPDPPAPFGPTVHPALVTAGSLASYFTGCTYVALDDAMFVPGGVLLKRSAFDGIYGGPRFYLGVENDKPSKSAWDAFRTNEAVRLPRAYRTCFRPELEAGAVVTIEGIPHLNAYTPAQVRRVPGDASRFVEHVQRMLPNGDDAELLLHWMASCVQNPGRKFQWWPVIQGAKGNGKTLLLTVMMYAIGSRYSHLVNSEAMQKTGNQFNAWIERKLFLGFEEIHSSGSQRSLVDMMKDTVTNRRIVSEGKGGAQDTADNRANGMMLTNHDDAVPIDDNERRWGIFWSAQQTLADIERDGMGGSYFPSLYDWLDYEDGLAVCAHYLATRPLVAAMDPARDLQRAPATSSTRAAVAGSLGRIEQEVLEAVGDERFGFRGGMVSSHALKSLMQSLHITLGPKRYASLMQALGYVKHEGMTDGRVNNALSDGSKPRLYFISGHHALAEPANVAVKIYEAAQTGETNSNVVPFKVPK